MANFIAREYKRKNEGIHADGRGPDEMTWEEIETKRIETEKFIAKQMDWRYYLPEAMQTREVREQIDELQEENNYSDVQDIKCIEIIIPKWIQGIGKIKKCAFAV